VLTGHYRLLDPQNRRYAWGSFEDCRAELEKIKQRRQLPPMRGKVVIVLHGLVCTWHSMSRLCEHLEENGKYLVLNVSYPSTRGNIGQFAKSLDRIVRNLDGEIEEINFVGHSMGNLVIRCYLADQAAKAGQAAAEPGKRPHPPVKRIVMLAPPNNGSQRAETWSHDHLFQLVLGPSGQELGPAWPQLEQKLATPACEFGVIAGGRGDDRGWSHALGGDDDGTISVATTRLPGARDFVVVPVKHTFFATHRKVLEYTLRFLQSGYFIDAEHRQPILAEDDAEPARVLASPSDR
jgi:pimeloyl-ACP methyl ester carboxylesterase